MKDAFIQRLTKLAATNPKLMLVVGDLGFGMVESFVARFPKQYLNVGVAEQNMIGVATGLAMEGFTVFTYSIANFATLRCLEQIRNDAAYHGANVKVVAMGGGFSYGALGISHHATEDLAILRSLPDLTVLSPADDFEAAEATQAAAERNGTCYLRLDKSVSGLAPREGERFELGKARLMRKGDAITIVATGGIVGVALRAAETLRHQRGLETRVLSMHTIKPLDVNSLEEAALETGGIITLEEHNVDGGLGGAVAECLLESGKTPKIFRRMGLRAGFSSVVGSQSYLRTRYSMDEAAVSAVLSDCLGLKS